MRINHNIAALNTYRQLTTNTTNTNKALEKLSSGLRINKAGDDAAGLSISEKMRAQIRGLDQAARNAQDGISLIQTAEGALQEVHAILQRMRELAVQAANDTNADEDRDALQDEVTELAAELQRIMENTTFNTKEVLDGTIGTVNIHVGADEGQVMELDFSTDGINLSTVVTDMEGVDIGASGDYDAAITSIQAAIETVSAGRSLLGAYQNRLEHTINNLTNASENLTASESRIRDVDMAREMMEFTKNTILTQAAQAMLAQANQQPQSVLQLLR